MKRTILYFCLVSGFLYSLGVLPTAAAPRLAAAPTIFDVTPTMVYNQTDSEIAITGVGFVDTPVVTLNGSNLQPIVLSNVQFFSNTQIQATVPAGTAEGSYNVIVYNPDGGQSNTLAQAVTIVRPGDAQMSGWIKTNPISDTRTAFQTVIAANNLYIIGGCAQSSPGMAITSVIRGTIGSDGTLGAWQTMAPLNKARCSFTAVTANGYIYVIGGAIGIGFPTETSIERSQINPDGSLSAWEVIGDLPEIRFNAGAVVVNNFLYVMDGWAGWSSSDPPADTIRAPITADGALGAWSTVQPTAGKSQAAVSFNAFIFALNSDGTIERSVVEADGSLAPWVYVPATMVNHPYGALAVLRGNLVVIGGMGGTSPNTYTLTNVERASIHTDGSLDAWAFAPSLLAGRASFATATSDTFLYAVGGNADTEGRATIEFTAAATAATDKPYALYLPIVSHPSSSEE